MIVFTFEILQIKRREALAIAAIGGGTWVLGYGVWMKKGRELFVGSYRSLHQTPISPIQFQQTMSHSDPSNRYSYTPTLNWNPQVHHYFLKAYGADHFSRISTALTYALRTTHYAPSKPIILLPTLWFLFSFRIRRRPSRYSCIRVNTLRSTGDAVIHKLRSLVPNADVPPPQSDSGDDVANPLKECSAAAAAPISKCEIPGLDYVVFVWGSITAMRLPRRSLLVGSVLRCSG